MERRITGQCHPACLSKEIFGGANRNVRKGVSGIPLDNRLRHPPELIVDCALNHQSGRRLLGTAGALGVGGRLFGELWLPLRGETGVVSQLEMPGLARPLRTPHRLTPQPRWTLHWVIVVDPHELIQLLENLPVWQRYAALKTLSALKVSGKGLAE